ncbi:alpha/beta hydrolase [Streptomyces sp. NBC_01341]|uniref:alpha/beta fold hydrolase n=1 Tax=Streptomyces sp. NBC_01341 TaxID=2903831 RepID=UPI002E103F46|nr:alpha/beta hydrolase [Streptomyces sp. NBC_01341]
MKEQRISIDGQRVSYTASEGTGRTVVLVHGNSSSSRVWRHLLNGPFGERYRCLAPDLPGHGGSAHFGRADDYSLRSYASVLAGFVRELQAEDAVMVGWSLGGHIALEAASVLPEAAGFVLFGTPPVGSPADVGRAFLPNPAMGVGFSPEVDAEAALSYARSFLAPGSKLPTEELVADVLATDGAARAGLLASLQAGAFADERAVVEHLTQPLAVLHGEGEQLVSSEYLNGISMPTLWRGAVQILPGVGHAPHLEAPEDFAHILTRFITDLG